MNLKEAQATAEHVREALDNYFRTKSYGVVCGPHWKNNGLPEDVAKDSISTKTEAVSQVSPIIGGLYSANLLVCSMRPTFVRASIGLGPGRGLTKFIEKTLQGKTVNLWVDFRLNQLSYAFRLYTGEYFHVNIRIIETNEL